MDKTSNIRNLNNAKRGLSAEVNHILDVIIGCSGFPKTSVTPDMLGPILKFTRFISDFVELVVENQSITDTLQKFIGAIGVRSRIPPHLVKNIIASQHKDFIQLGKTRNVKGIVEELLEIFEIVSNVKIGSDAFGMVVDDIDTTRDIPLRSYSSMSSLPMPSRIESPRHASHASLPLPSRSTSLPIDNISLPVEEDPIDNAQDAIEDVPVDAEVPDADASIAVESVVSDVIEEDSVTDESVAPEVVDEQPIAPIVDDSSIPTEASFIINSSNSVESIVNDAQPNSTPAEDVVSDVQLADDSSIPTEDSFIVNDVQPVNTDAIPTEDENVDSDTQLTDVNTIPTEDESVVSDVQPMIDSTTQTEDENVVSDVQPMIDSTTQTEDSFIVNDAQPTESENVVPDVQSAFNDAQLVVSSLNLENQVLQERIRTSKVVIILIN